MVLSNDIAALVGFACEAVLWGVYAVLFAASVYLLLRRSRRRSMNTPIFVANCALFASCTAHFALEFNHFYTTLRATGVEGYANETIPLVGADILISFSDLLGDLVLLYRCWVIWSKDYRVVLVPFITAAAGFACVMEVAHLVVTMDPTAPVPPAALVPLGVAGYTLPLATNFMVTALITAKLWSTAQRAEKRVEMRMTGTMRAARRAVAVIVESGVLYLVTQLVFVVLFSLGHPAEAILAVISVQIYGIAPTLIIIRVALGISSDYTVQVNNSSTTQFALDSESGPLPPRSAFVPAIHSLSGATEESGHTLPSDNELLEMKTLDLEFDGFAVAV